VNIYNNTLWMRGLAVQLYNYLTDSEFVNNIFATMGSGRYVVIADEPSTNDTNHWSNNVLVHSAGGAGVAMLETQGQSLFQPNCDGWNAAHTTYDGSKDCSLAFEPPVIPCRHGPAAYPSAIPASAVGLSTFQAAARAGQWFGRGSGQGDGWGVAPALVDPTHASTAHLHLLTNDVIAKDKGMALAPAFTDIDANPRPLGNAWDIGADEK
jgi:hypothetical protein